MKTNWIKYLSYAMFALVISVILLIFGFISKGFIENFDLSVIIGMGEMGLLPKILTTFFVVIISLMIGLSVGVFTAAYLSQYLKNKKISKMFDLLLSTLNSIPSVIFGLFGYSIFVMVFHLPVSTLVGGMTLGLMILPTIIFVSKAAMDNVDENLIVAAYALGGSKWKIIKNIIFLEVKGGIINSIILSLSKILGESAALVLTMGTAYDFTRNVLDQSRTLASHMLVVIHSDVLSSAEIAKTMYITGFVILALAGILIIISEKILKREK